MGGVDRWQLGYESEVGNQRMKGDSMKDIACFSLKHLIVLTMLLALATIDSDGVLE